MCVLSMCASLKSEAGNGSEQSTFARVSLVKSRLILFVIKGALLRLVSFEPLCMCVNDSCVCLSVFVRVSVCLCVCWLVCCAR